MAKKTLHELQYDISKQLRKDLADKVNTQQATIKAVKKRILHNKMVREQNVDDLLAKLRTRRKESVANFGKYINDVKYADIVEPYEYEMHKEKFTAPYHPMVADTKKAPPNPHWTKDLDEDNTPVVVKVPHPATKNVRAYLATRTTDNAKITKQKSQDDLLLTQVIGNVKSLSTKLSGFSFSPRKIMRSVLSKLTNACIFWSMWFLAALVTTLSTAIVLAIEFASAHPGAELTLKELIASMGTWQELWFFTILPGPIVITVALFTIVLLLDIIEVWASKAWAEIAEYWK